jgi:hypothetical protein
LFRSRFYVSSRHSPVERSVSLTMRLTVALLSLVLFCQAVTPGHGTHAVLIQSHFACLARRPHADMLMHPLHSQVLLLLHEGICCKPPPQSQ